jgi:hypothetical protein
MNLKAVLLDAKKAVGAAITIEGTAVTLGLIDKPTDAFITAVLGAVVTAIVYLLDNVPQGKPSLHSLAAALAANTAQVTALARVSKEDLRKISAAVGAKPVHLHVDGKEQIATEVDPLNMHTDAPTNGA